MAPHPEQLVLMAGLRPVDHPALRKVSNGELDEERKQELIMEKRLRACRVSIIPKVREREGKRGGERLEYFICRGPTTMSRHLLQKKHHHLRYVWRR